MADIQPQKLPDTQKQPTIKKPTEIAKRRTKAINDTRIKYEAAGWSATYLSGKAQMDIFATRGEGTKQKIHFIKVIDFDIMTEPSTEETNQYIQNAFSNNAEPIYAYVQYKGEKLDRIALQDINLNKAMRLVAAGMKASCVDDNVVAKKEDKQVEKKEDKPIVKKEIVKSKKQEK